MNTKDLFKQYANAQIAANNAQTLYLELKKKSGVLYDNNVIDLRIESKYLSYLEQQTKANICYEKFMSAALNDPAYIKTRSNDDVYNDVISTLFRLPDEAQKPRQEKKKGRPRHYSNEQRRARKRIADNIRNYKDQLEKLGIPKYDSRNSKDRRAMLEYYARELTIEVPEYLPGHEDEALFEMVQFAKIGTPDPDDPDYE